MATLLSTQMFFFRQEMSDVGGSGFTWKEPLCFASLLD